MSDDGASPGPRLLSGSTAREIVIVVSSILIAFGLDAGWDGIRRRAELEQQAVLVADELAATEAALMQAARAHDLTARQVREIREAVERVGPDREAVVSDTLFARVLAQFTMDVSTAALDAFLASGGLELIAAQETRSALRQWPTRIEDAIDDEVYLRNFPGAALADYLRREIDLSRTELASSIHLMAQVARETDQTPPETPPAWGSVALPYEPELLNRLAAREAHDRAMLRTLEPLLAVVRELREALAPAS